MELIDLNIDKESILQKDNHEHFSVQNNGSSISKARDSLQERSNFLASHIVAMVTYYSTDL